MLSKDLWVVFCALAAVTALCVARIVPPEVWVDGVRWIFVPYMTVKAISVIPWRRPPEGAHPHQDQLYRGIFAGGFAGGAELPPLTDDELTALDAEEPLPFPPPALPVRRGLFARLFRRRG